MTKEMCEVAIGFIFVIFICVIFFLTFTGIIDEPSAPITTTTTTNRR